jgi:hypothetical protein
MDLLAAIQAELEPTSEILVDVLASIASAESTLGEADPAEEPPQISDEEIHSLDESVDPGVQPGDDDGAAGLTSDETEMVASEEVHTVDTDASPPPSAIDPWLAQLVHGYCPPGSHLFDRPVPPTTMPGRDP